MPFSLAKIPTVVCVQVVHYSAIIHNHQLKTQLKQFANSFLLLTASTKIKYHEEIEFVINFKQPYNMVIGFITYFRFFYEIDLKYMFKNKLQRFLHLFMHWNVIKLVCFCKIVTYKKNKTCSVSYM